MATIKLQGGYEYGKIRDLLTGEMLQLGDEEHYLPVICCRKVVHTGDSYWSQEFVDELCLKSFTMYYAFCATTTHHLCSFESNYWVELIEWEAEFEDEPGDRNTLTYDDWERWERLRDDREAKLYEQIAYIDTSTYINVGDVDGENVVVIERFSARSNEDPFSMSIEELMDLTERGDGDSDWDHIMACIDQYIENLPEQQSSNNFIQSAFYEGEKLSESNG